MLRILYLRYVVLEFYKNDRVEQKQLSGTRLFYAVNYFNTSMHNNMAYYNYTINTNIYYCHKSIFCQMYFSVHQIKKSIILFF